MQLKAITHVKGPAGVIAGPGSGKTFTIVQRIQNLIFNNHVDPDKILTITFTKAAAQEMQSRYLEETADVVQNTMSSAHFGTFHGICYTILKESGLFRGFSLIKETDKRKIAEMILTNRGIRDASEYDNISSVLDGISRRKNEVTEKLSFNITEEEFDEIYWEYEEMLKQQKLLDYDDMLLKCLVCLTDNLSLRRKWQERFEYIQVDEFQDINEIQYRIVRLLALPGNNLFVVGDDDQSIYGFRGSTPGIIRQFMTDYEKAEQFFLTENYRSRDRIIELADKIIKRNTDRFAKSLIAMQKGGKVQISFCETRKEEELQLIRDLDSLSAKQAQNSAIIVRTNLEAFQYRALLKQHGIAVKERIKSKEDILHHFIAEDFAAFLRFCYEGNKRKDFIKIMNKPNIFLARRALVEDTVTGEGLKKYYENNREMCRKIDTLFYHFNQASKMLPALAVRYFRKVMGYDAYLTQQTVNGNTLEILTKADRIQAVFKQMKQGEKTDSFLERMQKNCPEEKDSKKVTPGISVITMHGSKGLEFHSVFLPDLNEGIIPGKKAETPEMIEEERRLLYVAVTRAKESLYLYYTRERNRKLTRFLEGIIPPPYQ